PTPEPVPPSLPEKKTSRWLRLSWALPVVALIIALIVQFSGGIPESASAAPEGKPAVAKDKVAEDKAVSTPIIKMTQPLQEPKLPLEHATIVPPLPVVVEQPVATPELTAAQSKSALILPFDAVKVGSTTFLNGNWRVSPDIKAAQTGRAPSLKYQIKNGKGTVKITHGDNVTCQANITAGLMKSGNLVINSRYRAQCSDGSKYQMPEIVCKQGLTGIADCKGRYDANTTLPMTMKRETK
ncbi:SrfA family protein, partial [Yersinia enterocolitica]